MIKSSREIANQHPRRRRQRRRLRRLQRKMGIREERLIVALNSFSFLSASLRHFDPLSDDETRAPRKLETCRSRPCVVMSDLVAGELLLASNNLFIKTFFLGHTVKERGKKGRRERARASSARSRFTTRPRGLRGETFLCQTLRL